MTSFIVAGGMGAVVSHYLHSTAPSLSFDKMLTELGMVVQPFNGLGMLLPALFGFFGGTLLLLFWNFVKTRMIRYLLQCNMWFLKPKHPINKVSGKGVHVSEPPRYKMVPLKGHLANCTQNLNFSVQLGKHKALQGKWVT